MRLHARALPRVKPRTDVLAKVVQLRIWVELTLKGVYLKTESARCVPASPFLVN
jgi:hypothetical protein